MLLDSCTQHDAQTSGRQRHQQLGLIVQDLALLGVLIESKDNWVSFAEGAVGLQDHGLNHTNGVENQAESEHTGGGSYDEA